MKITWSAVIIIVALAFISFLDNQFFYEPEAALSVPPIERQLVHLVVLGLYMFAGYKLIARHNVVWLRNLWLLTYSIVIIALAAIGLVQAVFNFFGTDFMLQISNMRILFSTPLPLIVAMFVAQKGSDNYKDTATKML